VRSLSFYVLCSECGDLYYFLYSQSAGRVPPCQVIRQVITREHNREQVLNSSDAVVHSIPCSLHNAYALPKLSLSLFECTSEAV